MKADLHEDIEKLNDLLSWYESVINNIEKYKDEHRDDFINNKYYWYYLLLEKSIWLLVKLLDSLNYIDKSSWKPHYSTQLVFITNTIPFIYSSFDNILNWQYQIASISNRTSFESLLRVYFISFNPDNYWWVFWELNRKDLISKWFNPPKFNIMNLLDQKLNWKFKDIYTVLSHESHSSILTVWNDLKNIREWTYKIGINIQWDIDFSYNMNILTFLIYAFLKYIDDILLDNIKISVLNESWKEKINNVIKNKDYMIKFLESYLDDSPNKRKFNNEINEVMELIKDLEFNK